MAQSSEVRTLSNKSLLSLCASVVLASAALGCGKADAPPAPGPETEPLPVMETATGVMVRIPEGVFRMGSREGEANEQPEHEVRVDAFLMDRCEVTQRQFVDLMGRNPSHFEEPECPVEQVAWAGAALYCNARSRKEGLEPCYDEETGACDFSANGYRLPTEAEWEYACRAGSAGRYSFGEDARSLTGYGWFEGNAGGRSRPVGQRQPNAWSLRDMHGNVFEWCNDVYDEAYYAKSPTENPHGPEDTPDARFVIRGGGWQSPPEACRSAYREGEDPGQVDACISRDDVGFRCVREAPLAQ